MALLDRRFRKHTASKKCARLGLEALEDRCVPATASLVTMNFNPTAITAGDTLWFSSSFSASGLPQDASVTLHVDNGSIDFTAGGTPYHVSVPNAVIVLTPKATSASASFDTTANDWNVRAPSAGAGDVFMGGASLALPQGLPGGVHQVTWSADFWSDTANVKVDWHASAAVYTNFSTNDALGVKPVDNHKLSVYANNDLAGTPELFKAYIAAGGVGNGRGGNYTGNPSLDTTVKPDLSDALPAYPYPSGNPLTSVAFNESSVLRAAYLDTTNGYLDVWYSDEHALALGVRQVNVITSSGTTTTNYSISTMTTNPSVAVNPSFGTSATGDQSGADTSGRPIAPSLYITDVTNDPNNRSGDWQFGGTAYAPSEVFGTWKAFTRTVNEAGAKSVVKLTADADPGKNYWNLGPGSDAPPAGLTNQGYGAEVRWNLNALYSQGVLLPGHNYRFYVIVHDGDQNRAGGDAGQASYVYYYPGPALLPANLSGTVINGNTGEALIGVTLTLSQLVNNQWVFVTTATTGNGGSYQFTNLQPGTYQVTQTPPPLPSGYLYETTLSAAGTVNGVKDGTANSDVITGIQLTLGNVGVQYDFTDLFAAS